MSLKVLTIDITSRCPNRCVHCETQKESSLISVEKAKTIIDKASREELTDIVISGGEPFTHPSLLDIVKYCHEANIYVSILTSASVVDEKLILNLAKYTNVAFFRISMESANPEKLDWIRNSPGNYKNIARFIKILRTTGKPFGISCTVNQWNEDDIAGVFRFALNNKAAFVRFVPYISADSSKSYPPGRLLYLVLDVAASAAGAVRAGIAFVPENRDSLAGLFRSRCPAGIFTAYLNSSMEFGFCPFINNHISLESTDAGGFDAAWSKLQHLRNNEFSPDQPCLLGNNYFIHTHLSKYIERTDLFSQPLDSPHRTVISKIVARQKEILSTGFAPCWRSSPLLLFPLQA